MNAWHRSKQENPALWLPVSLPPNFVSCLMLMTLDHPPTASWIPLRCRLLLFWSTINISKWAFHHDLFFLGFILLPCGKNSNRAVWSSKDLILSALHHTPSYSQVGRKLTLGETMHEERLSYLQRNRMATGDIKHIWWLFVTVGKRERRGLIKKSVQGVQGHKKSKNRRFVSETHAKKEERGAQQWWCQLCKERVCVWGGKERIKSFDRVKSLGWDWANLPPTFLKYWTCMSIVQHKSQSVEWRVELWT